MGERELDTRKTIALEGLRSTASDNAALGMFGGGGQASTIDRALAFLEPAAGGLGFAAGEASGYFPDPVVQRTSSGAASVHLHQQYRGLTIFQMAQAVRFGIDGGPKDALGLAAANPVGLDLEPKVSGAAAVVAAARYLAETGGGEEEPDAFGQVTTAATISVGGDFAPAALASFPLPSRPTVFEKGPFENPIPAYLLIFDRPDGPRLAWHVVLTFPNYEDQYVMIVAADDPAAEILYCKSSLHRARAHGNVYEFSPAAGPRQMVDFPRPVTDYAVVLSNPLPGFPADWVSAATAMGNSTRATLNFSTSTLSGTPGTDPVEFDPADPFGDDQKLLNIFYFCNYMHDFLYLVGFDEASGNFQQVNFTHTGLANDPVLARAHSGRVTGTANMATPPDGRPPVMNMGLVQGQRHTAFDADVVFHEYAHGLTNRLVGGLMQGHALDEPQSRGMGEGWSDFYALTVQNFFRARHGLPERVVVGDWVVSDAAGIRTAPYDDNYPLGYGDLNGMGGEHDVGEVWCAALMMARRRIEAAIGNSEESYRIAWALVADGLKLTPANPSFLDARDAILRALDDLRDGGLLTPTTHWAVRPALWRSFAHFGMGSGASSGDAGLTRIVADTSLPADL